VLALQPLGGVEAGRLHRAHGGEQLLRRPWVGAAGAVGRAPNSHRRFDRGNHAGLNALLSVGMGHAKSTGRRLRYRGLARFGQAMRPPAIGSVHAELVAH